ncbi:MAG: tetratricopeptide repeat protein [Cyanobacteriota bacterium]|nr:tetratricopeptide repeat protein [Cyanobacteriota bacterium]
MRLTPATSIGLILAMLLLGGNARPGRAETEGQFASRSDASRAADSQPIDCIGDRPCSTLWWLALFPLLGGASMGLGLHWLEKRAGRYLRQLHTLESKVLGETEALSVEIKVMSNQIRDYLDRPYNGRSIEIETDGSQEKFSHTNPEDWHDSESDRSFDPTHLPFDLDGEYRTSDGYSTERSPTEGTTGRTYLDTDDRDSVVRDRSAREYCARGNHLFLEARYTEAIEAYDRAIQLCPSYHQAWCNRGSAFFQLQQYERAISDTDRALAIWSDYAEAWNNRGGALAKLKRIPEALISYNKALQLKPRYPDAWINRGLALMELGQYREALFAYTKAEGFQSGDREIWFYRAQALKGLQRYADALEAYDRALAVQPEQPKFFYYKATCYALQGNIDLALTNLQQAILFGNDSGFKFENYQLQAQTETAFASLRNDPRFLQLVRHSSPD